MDDDWSTCMMGQTAAAGDHWNWTPGIADNSWVMSAMDYGYMEFARIGGDLSHGDRERAARDFAMAHGCVLVLKGHRTVTASPEGDVLVNTTGGSGLAKGGSGDVLTGVIASLMAQRADALRAAAVGVWLHGRAGDLAEQELTAYSVTPEDVVRKLPDAIREILE